jgi:hypothetical protein
MRTKPVCGLVALGAILIATVNCSSNTETIETSGVGGAGGAGPGPGPGPTTTMSGPATTSTGMVVDESTSCADAVALMPQMNGLGGTFYDYPMAKLGEPEDHDYFTFTAEDDSWIQVITDADPNDDPALLIDTVIRLQDGAGTEVLAEVDDAYPRISTDSELFYHVTTGGTFCLEVLDFSEWSGAAPAGDATFVYRPVVVPVDFDLYDQYNLDTEPNDTLLAPQTGLSSITGMMSTQIFTTVEGLLEPGTDVDVYEITMPVGAIGIDINMTPAGSVKGFGSSKGPGLVTLYDVDGITPLAQVDNQNAFFGGNGDFGISAVPIVEAGTYLLEVRRPDVMVGANDFYFLKIGTRDILNPQEMNDAGNGVQGGAEVATSEMSADPKVTPHFLGGTLPEGDVDFWTIDTQAVAGDSLILNCASWSGGSGIRGLEATYSDSTGMTPNFSQVEDEGKGLYWATVPMSMDPTAAKIDVLSSGPHYIKFENLVSSPDGLAQDKHYLCNIVRVQP